MKMLRTTKPFAGLKDSRGDTIVEVLIAVAVISMVLVTAFAMTNRNVQASQDTQEQGQAQKLVERQVEILRSDPTAITGNSCFNSTAAAVSGTACTLKSDGTTAPAGYSGAAYAITISKDAVKYTISANWNSPSGSSRNITIYYKAIQP